ncbi:26S proteasome subunit Rpn1 [Acrasis kona]|uniref:26S proteasome subunit Rpn1 n=1 Tax=Acrasis kona TaxID=1008807 RepID=A0AAW2YMJ7_9EUKA
MTTPPEVPVQDNKDNNDNKDKKVVKGKGKVDLNALSEEDEKYKQDIEMIIERVCENDENIQKTALDQIRSELTQETGTVTSVPKSLKFIKPHYDRLKETYAKAPASNKKNFAQLLSVLAMTLGKEDEREIIKYRLEGGDEDLQNWGHEYISALAGEVGKEFDHRSLSNPDLKDTDVEDLLELTKKLIPSMIKNNAEPEACDLLLEIERPKLIIDYSEPTNYKRICDYLESVAKYQLTPDDIEIRRIVYDVYTKQNKYIDALRIALLLNDRDLIKETFSHNEDKVVQKQMAIMLGRAFVKLEPEDDEDGSLSSLIGNTKLSEHYLYLAKELDSLDPKTPEDIYKSHLNENRSTLSQNIDSAKQNLAATFVNGFVNAGYGTDKLMTDEGSRWLYRNKDHGMMSAAASLGLLYLWNVDEGLAEVDKYLYSVEDFIKGGALLALGIVNAGVRSEVDAALALLGDYIESDKHDLRVGAILGLGIAYAGSAHEDVNEQLMPILADGDQPIEIVAFTALSLGLIFVGTANDDITEAIVQVLMERDEKTLSNTLVRYLCLALGFLFLGKQDAAKPIIETTKTLNAKIAGYCELTVETCAYAGTGNVLKVQQLLKICGEHLEEGKENRHQALAVIGIATIAMGEELGTEMATRSFDHLLQYADVNVKRAVPLALGLMNVSNPKMTVMDTLSKLSHDSDAEVAQGAIMALGLIGAGTNNARAAQMLRQLSTYYAKESSHLLVVRIAQGLLFAGKGLISLSPYFYDRTLLQPVVLCGLLTTMHTCLDLKKILLSQYHYLLYHLSLAMRPRMMITVDEDMNPLPVSVRVGTAVDTVAQAGRPKTITGFQTHNSPVILQFDDRAELGTEKYLSVSTILEGVVILKKNPDYVEEQE